MNVIAAAIVKLEDPQIVTEYERTSQKCLLGNGVVT